MGRDALGRVNVAAALEIIRAYVRTEERRGYSLAEIAETVAVPLATLRSLMESGRVSRDTFDQLTVFTNNRPGVMPAVGRMGLAVLVDDVPRRMRPRARRLVARALVTLYVAEGTAVPPWLAEEAGF